MRYINLLKYLSNWWLHFAVKLGITKADPLLFKARGGVVVEVPRRLLHEFKEIFMENAYLAGLGGALPPSPVIIDVGSNAGFFSLFAAACFPGARILSFEPIPANFKQLSRNKELNGRIQMTCFPQAVYGHVGEIFLSFDPDDSFTTSATVLRRSGRKTGLTVSCTTLQQIFEKHRINRCDLLKLDCEGAEFDILYKCPPDLFPQIERIAMEVHNGDDKDQNLRSLVSFLSSRGYVVSHRKQMLWAWHSLTDTFRK